MTLQRTELAPLSEYAIETHGLTKKFGSFTAVDHVDLAVGKGEIYGFLSLFTMAIAVPIFNRAMAR